MVVLVKALKIITIPLMMLSNQSLTLLEINRKILEIVPLPVQKRSQLVGFDFRFMCVCVLCSYLRIYRLLPTDPFFGSTFSSEICLCLFGLSPSFSNSR